MTNDETIMRIRDLKLTPGGNHERVRLTLEGNISVEAYLDLARHHYYGNAVRVELVQMQLPEPLPDQTLLDQALEELQEPSPDDVLAEAVETARAAQAEVEPDVDELEAEAASGRVLHYVVAGGRSRVVHLSDRLQPMCGRREADTFRVDSRGERRVCMPCLRLMEDNDRLYDPERDQEVTDA